MNSVFHIFYLTINVFSLASCVTKLQKHFEWTSIDFDYGSENERIIAKVEKKFAPENNLPVGIEIWYDKIFITVPRWKEGVPSTLNYVPINSPIINPRLIPYPDLTSNELGNCEKGLSTVYRIAIDICDRLWVLDTGTFGIGDTTRNLCPYALNIFNLKTDTKIRRYVFRPEDTKTKSFIANIAVEVGKSCEDAHAYFSDELGYGLIVYSYEQNRSWRFEHSYFYPDPLRERGPNSHTTARVMSREGIQFFNLIDQNAIGCWNSGTRLDPTNLGIIDKDDLELIFPADIKIDKFNNVWVLSDRMPRFLITSLDYSEPNFRLFFAPVDVLVEGTVCENHIKNREFYRVMDNLPCQVIRPAGSTLKKLE